MLSFIPKVGQVWKSKTLLGGFRRIVVVIELPNRNLKLIKFFNLYSLYNKILNGHISSEYFDPKEEICSKWELFE